MEDRAEAQRLREEAAKLTASATTTTAQHTPGPWRIGGKGGGTQFDIQDEAGTTHIARVSHRGAIDAEAEADTRLIAAAPELLAALKSVRLVDVHSAARELIKAAIAKATNTTL